ncbi:MAG: hypothetical protein ACRDFQ_00350 [Anaerolineales bacterium]
MTYPNNQSVVDLSVPASVSEAPIPSDPHRGRARLEPERSKGEWEGKQPPGLNRDLAYDNLQNVILKLAVKKDDVRSAPAARTEFTQLVEQALDAYRVYMQAIAGGEI